MKRRGSVNRNPASPGSVQVLPTGQDRFREVHVPPGAILASCQIANSYIQPGSVWKGAKGCWQPNDWAGHRPNCRQITQCDSPIAEAETDTQARVSIGTAFRDWHQGALRASIGTLSGNVVGQAFGPREPESPAGLRFVPKLILCRTVRGS